MKFEYKIEHIFSSPMKVIVDKNMLLQISEYVKGMQKQFNEMKITFDEVAEENKKLKSELEKKDDKIQKLENEIIDLRADKERMMNSFNSEKNNQIQQINNLKKQIDVRDSDISCLKRNLENNERRMVSELKDKREEINRLQNIIREKESTIDNYSKNYVYLYDKGDYNKVNIMKTEMNDDRTNFTIRITREYLNEHGGNGSIYIRDRMSSVYGGSWCCILELKGGGGAAWNKVNGYRIQFTMGEFLVIIFKEND